MKNYISLRCTVRRPPPWIPRFSQDFIRSSLPRPTAIKLQKMMAPSKVQPHVWVSQWTPEETASNTQHAGLDPLSRTRFISRTMFECEGNLPAREWHGYIEHFMDEVWVPSVWNKNTWAKSHIDPDKIKVNMCRHSWDTQA